MFEIVENQQGVLVLKTVGNHLQNWALTAFADIEGAGDGGQNELGIGDRGEGDEDDTVRENGRGMRADADGQPSLADTAWTGQRQETNPPAQERAGRGSLGLPADQRGERPGQAVVAGKRRGI